MRIAGSIHRQIALIVGCSSRGPNGAFTARPGRRRRMDDADGLAAMPLALGQGPAHAAVEGLDGGVEDAAGRIEVARAKGIGVAGQPGAREGQAIGRRRAPERRRDLVRLHRLVVAVAAGRAVKGSSRPRRAGIGPRGPEHRAARRTAARGALSGSNGPVGVPGSAAMAGRSRQASASGTGRLGIGDQAAQLGRPSSSAAWCTSASALET